MFNTDFIGKWGWEGKDASKRSIEFADDHGRLIFRIIDDGRDAWTPKVLEIEKHGDTYFFTNRWMSENGDVLFLYEVWNHAGEAGDGNTFLNVQEWRIISGNSLKQVNRGFKFDRKENTWKEFHEESLLRKMS